MHGAVCLFSREFLNHSNVHGTRCRCFSTPQSSHVFQGNAKSIQSLLFHLFKVLQSCFFRHLFSFCFLLFLVLLLSRHGFVQCLFNRSFHSLVLGVCFSFLSLTCLGVLHFNLFFTGVFFHGGTTAIQCNVSSMHP